MKRGPQETTTWNSQHALLPSPKEEKEGRSEAQHGRGEETHLSLGDVQMWIDDETPSVLCCSNEKEEVGWKFSLPVRSEERGNIENTEFFLCVVDKVEGSEFMKKDHLV